MSITRKQNFPITGMLHSTIHVLGTPNIYAANILFKVYVFHSKNISSWKQTFH